MTSVPSLRAEIRLHEERIRELQRRLASRSNTTHGVSADRTLARAPEEIDRLRRIITDLEARIRRLDGR